MSDKVIIIIVKSTGDSLGTALIAWIFLFLLPSILASWLIGGLPFTEALTGVALSPWGWFWSGICWAGLLAAIRLWAAALLPLAISLIAALVIAAQWGRYWMAPRPTGPFSRSGGTVCQKSP